MEEKKEQVETKEDTEERKEPRPPKTSIVPELPPRKPRQKAEMKGRKRKAVKALLGHKDTDYVYPKYEPDEKGVSNPTIIDKLSKSFKYSKFEGHYVPPVAKKKKKKNPTVRYFKYTSENKGKVWGIVCY